MHYGICNLGIVPIRSEPLENSRLINQLLYGESFTILEERKTCALIRTALDDFEGWVDNKQFLKIAESDYHKLQADDTVLSSDLVEYISDQQQRLMAIPLGAVLNYLPEFHHHFDGNFCSGKKSKEELIPTALLFLNAPAFNGGRTPFGIDSNGLAQMVYRLNGYRIPRELLLQAQQGESLSFIEESQPGDLVFFDDAEGNINHVGLMMADHHILHVYGKVRMDRIDHSGIYNEELSRHTHKLRVIKKLI